MLRGILCIVGIVFLGLAHGQNPGALMPVNLETILKLSGTNNLKIAEINARYDLAVAQHSEAKEWLLARVY